MVFMSAGTVKAGLFSNDGIILEEINCEVKISGGFQLVIAKLDVGIWYGHDDVNLFHPVEALTCDESQTFNLDVVSSENTGQFKISAINIQLPDNCTKHGYEEETLRSVEFKLQLCFINEKNEFELLCVSPKRMDGKEEIRFAKSKKLAKRLSSIFSKINADYANNNFTIENQNDGAVYPEVIKDPLLMSELERIAKANKLHRKEK